MKEVSKVFEKSLLDLLHYEKEHAIEKIITKVFEAIMQAERREFLKAKDNQDVKNKANGYYARTLKAVNMFFNLKIPRDRLAAFKPEFLNIMQIEESKRMDLVYSLYSKGMHTRSISSVLADVYGDKISATTVSNISKSYDSECASWRNKKLSSEYYFIYSDGVHLKVRRNNVASEAFYIIIGVTKNFKREVLGVYNIPVESSSGWEFVYRDLKERGLERVLGIITDELSGLQKILSNEFPKAAIQACVVHKKRRVLSLVRHQDKKAIMSDLHEVFVVGDKNYKLEDAIKSVEKFKEKWSRYYPGIHRVLSKYNYENYFAYLKFPSSIQSMIYTTNWIERLNKTVKQVTKTRNSFPNPNSSLRLVTSALMSHEESNYQRYPVGSFKSSKYELDMLFEEFYQEE